MMAKEVNWPWSAEQHKAPLSDGRRGVQHMRHSGNASVGMSAATPLYDMLLCDIRKRWGSKGPAGEYDHSANTMLNILH